MPEMFKKMNAFVQECADDSLKLQINSIKFKSFLIHSPNSPTTGEQRIYLLLEYSLQELWQDLRSDFQKEHFHDIQEIWELLYSETENRFYLYWVYDLSSIDNLEIIHLKDGLKAA